LTFGASVTLDASPDWRVVTFSGVVALLTAVGIGAGPAWRAARTTPAALISRGFGGAVESRRKQVLFVAAQVGACTVLLVVASLYVRSALALYAHDPGFDGSRIARIGVDLRMAGLDQPHSRELLSDVLDRMRALPQVHRAFLTMNYPQRLTGQPTALIADVGVADHQPRTSGYFARVSTGFFEALHLPIVSGRSFLPSDNPSAPRVAIVNESAAALWPDGRAVGGRLALSNSDGAWLDVVGVARDSDVETPGHHGPMAFLPLEQAPYARVSVMVETDARPESALGAMRAVVTGIDPDVVIVDSSTVAADQAQLTLPIRLAAAGLAGVGGVGLAIALLGLYAVSARAVRTRTREIGVRMALGANAGAVQAMVLRQSMAMLAGGLVPGLVLALIANGILRSTLYGLGTLDVVTFVGVPACLVTAGLLAALRPARRASRVDPTVALREL
jgi:predicted permease